MKKIAKLLLALLALTVGAVVSPATADAAGTPVEIFLTIDGIKGEVTDAAFPGAIAVTSYQSHVGSGLMGGQGGAVFREIGVGHASDAASPYLAMAAANGGKGDVFKKAQFNFRRTGSNREVFLRITIHEVRVATVQTVATSAGGDVPMEQFALAYQKIEWEYRSQKADGTLGPWIRTSWDVRTNRGW